MYLVNLFFGIKTFYYSKINFRCIISKTFLIISLYFNLFILYILFYYKLRIKNNIFKKNHCNCYGIIFKRDTIPF